MEGENQESIGLNSSTSPESEEYIKTSSEKELNERGRKSQVIYIKENKQPHSFQSKNATKVFDHRFTTDGGLSKKKFSSITEKPPKKTLEKEKHFSSKKEGAKKPVSKEQKSKPKPKHPELSLTNSNHQKTEKNKHENNTVKTNNSDNKNQKIRARTTENRKEVKNEIKGRKTKSKTLNKTTENQATVLSNEEKFNRRRNYQPPHQNLRSTPKKETENEKIETLENEEEEENEKRMEQIQTLVDNQRQQEVKNCENRFKKDQESKQTLEIERRIKKLQENGEIDDVMREINSRDNEEEEEEGEENEEEGENEGGKEGEEENEGEKVETKSHIETEISHPNVKNEGESESSPIQVETTENNQHLETDTFRKSTGNKAKKERAKSQTPSGRQTPLKAVRPPIKLYQGHNGPRGKSANESYERIRNSPKKKKVDSLEYMKIIFSILPREELSEKSLGSSKEKTEKSGFNICNVDERTKMVLDEDNNMVMPYKNLPKGNKRDMTESIIRKKRELSEKKMEEEKEKQKEAIKIFFSLNKIEEDAIKSRTIIMRSRSKKNTYTTSVNESTSTIPDKEQYNYNVRKAREVIEIGDSKANQQFERETNQHHQYLEGIQNKVLAEAVGEDRNETSMDQNEIAKHDPSNTYKTLQEAGEVQSNAKEALGMETKKEERKEKLQEEKEEPAHSQTSKGESQEGILTEERIDDFNEAEKNINKSMTEDRDSEVPPQDSIKIPSTIGDMSKEGTIEAKKALTKKDLERIAEGFEILNFVSEAKKEFYKELLLEYLKLKYFYACNILNIVRIVKYLVMKDFYEYYVNARQREEKSKQNVEDNESIHDISHHENSEGPSSSFVLRPQQSLTLRSQDSPRFKSLKHLIVSQKSERSLLETSQSNSVKDLLNKTDIHNASVPKENNSKAHVEISKTLEGIAKNKGKALIKLDSSHSGRDIHKKHSYNEGDISAGDDNAKIEWQYSLNKPAKDTSSKEEEEKKDQVASISKEEYDDFDVNVQDDESNGDVDALSSFNEDIHNDSSSSKQRNYNKIEEVKEEEKVEPKVEQKVVEKVEPKVEPKVEQKVEEKVEPVEPEVEEKEIVQQPDTAKKEDVPIQAPEGVSLSKSILSSHKAEENNRYNPELVGEKEEKIVLAPESLSREDVTEERNQKINLLKSEGKSLNDIADQITEQIMKQILSDEFEEGQPLVPLKNLRSNQDSPSKGGSNGSSQESALNESIFMRTINEIKKENTLNLYNEKVAPILIGKISKELMSNYPAIYDNISKPLKYNEEDVMNNIMYDIKNKEDKYLNISRGPYSNEEILQHPEFIPKEKILNDFAEENKKLRNDDNIVSDDHYDKILNECLIDAANEIIEDERQYGNVGEPLMWSIRTKEIEYKYKKDENSKKKLNDHVVNELERLLNFKMALIGPNHKNLDSVQLNMDRDRKFLKSITEDLVKEDEEEKVFEKEETQIKLLQSRIIMDQLLNEVVEILEHVQLSRRNPEKYQHKSIFACEDIPRLSFQNTTDNNAILEDDNPNQ